MKMIIGVNSLLWINHMGKKRNKRIKTFWFNIRVDYFVCLCRLVSQSHHKLLSALFAVVGIVLMVSGLLRPSILKFSHGNWLRLSYCLSWINVRVVLGVLYFFMIIPIALVKRLFTTSEITLRIDEDLVTYKIVSVNAKPKQMEKPF